MWEVIEFGYSYEVPTNTTDTTTTTTTSGETGTKSGRTVTLTAEDMQKKKNDVKARTTLLLSPPDEHQLRFSKYKTAQELWAVILKTFSGNEATKKTKKNLLKQQYGNFRAMRADKFWKRTRKKISIQGSNVARFDKSKVECFNCHKMGHFSRECRAPRSQDRGRRDNFRQGSKAEEQDPKALMAIDGVGWDWSYMANDGEDHALVADKEAPIEFALMANTITESKVFDNSLCLKDCKKNNDSLNSKITDLTDKLFDTKNMIYHYKLALAQVESRLVEYKEREIKYIERIKTLEFYNESNKECIKTLKKKLGTLKQEKKGVDGKLAGLLTASKDLDNLIESQRSSPTVESTSEEDQNRNPSVSENVASPITPKPFIKFVKPKDSQSESKSDKKKTPKKPPVKYARQYRKPNKKPDVRGNQRNWNNLKSHQLGPDFVMKKKACFNCAMRSPYRAPWVSTVNRIYPPVNRKFSTGSRNFPTANRKFPTTSRKFPTGSTKSPTANIGMKGKVVKPSACWFWKPSQNLSNKGNISYLSDYEPFDRGYVSFGQRGCKITGKGTIKTGKLKFENVYFVKDLKYNLFSMSQICDNKNSVLFTNSKCIVLGRDFKLLDDANILLRTPRQHNIYSIDLNNIVLHIDLTCLVAKASADECMLWHKRLVTDDFSRFTWTFFLKSKDETSGILQKFITEIENLKDLKVKIIRCDNVGEFRNNEMNDFCSQKGIKREFSNAMTP
nr:ribonuclease H-like domain-containing protein [Tanacetum cinerariifolium]